MEMPSDAEILVHVNDVIENIDIVQIGESLDVPIQFAGHVVACCEVLNHCSSINFGVSKIFQQLGLLKKFRFRNK